MAFNEKANIRRLLDAILKQEFANGVLNEIYVIASGCTDGTEDAVLRFIERDKRVRLLIQETREGKASAINLFLKTASGEILILESADTLPAPGTLDRLIAVFDDPAVGMAGGRPVPVNSKDTFIGFVSNLMWSLHHKIALEAPKLGELVAFRNHVKQIPLNTAVDEACIEAIVRNAGYALRYVSEAVVYNKGPENIRDFIKQRRRITVGHLHLLNSCNYAVSTQNPLKILRLLLSRRQGNFKLALWEVGAIFLEAVGRLLGYYDFYICKNNRYIWEIATSTKCLH